MPQARTLGLKLITQILITESHVPHGRAPRTAPFAPPREVRHRHVEFKATRLRKACFTMSTSQPDSPATPAPDHAPTSAATASAPTSAPTSAISPTSHTSHTEVSPDGGRTVIESAVIAKLAGIATREVSGVASVGGPVSGGGRMLGTLRESLGAAEDVRQGVSVELSNSSAAISVAIIAEYGVAIHELADVIRRNISRAVESMTGLTVTRVDVTVHDVKLPNERVADPDTQAQAGNSASPSNSTALSSANAGAGAGSDAMGK